MILITGAAFAGKRQAADELFGDKYEVIDRLQDWVLEKIRQGADVYAECEKLCLKHEEAVFIIDEMGCGVVPVDPLDREWRELTGRVACMIAKKAEAVYRVQCGIALKIK